MKKLKLFISILFCMSILIQCSEKKQTKIEEILQEAKAEQEAQTEELIQQQVEEKPFIEYQNRGITWEVYAYELTNVHHVNGYVIFTKIIKRNTELELFEKWEIDYDVENYVQDIHYNLKSRFNGINEVQDVILQTDEKFKVAFRTAEAIYLAWVRTGENPVSIYAVKESAKSMEGRQVGIMR